MTEEQIRLTAQRDQVMAAMRRHRDAILLIALGKGKDVPNYDALAEMMACHISADLDLLDRGIL